MEYATMNRQEYCVYKHKIPNTDHVFYVGHGNLQRPFDYGRNEIWEKIIQDNNGAYDIEIVCMCDTKEEAAKIETILQKTYRYFGMCEACIVGTEEWLEKVASQQRGTVRGKSPQCANIIPKVGELNGMAKKVKVIDTVNNTEKIFPCIKDVADALGEQGATYKKIYTRLKNGKMFLSRYKFEEVQ